MTSRFPGIRSEPPEEVREIRRQRRERRQEASGPFGHGGRVTSPRGPNGQPVKSDGGTGRSEFDPAGGEVGRGGRPQHGRRAEEFEREDPADDVPRRNGSLSVVSLVPEGREADVAAGLAGALIGASTGWVLGGGEFAALVGTGFGAATGVGGLHLANRMRERR